MSKGKAGRISLRTSALSILMLLCYLFSSHVRAQDMPAVGSDSYSIILFVIGILSILACRRRFF